VDRPKESCAYRLEVPVCSGFGLPVRIVATRLQERFSILGRGTFQMRHQTRVRPTVGDARSSEMALETDHLTGPECRHTKMLVCGGSTCNPRRRNPRRRNRHRMILR